MWEVFSSSSNPTSWANGETLAAGSLEQVTDVSEKDEQDKWSLQNPKTQVESLNSITNGGSGYQIGDYITLQVSDGVDTNTSAVLQVDTVDQ